MHKNKYDHNILLNDIQKLDKIQHKHSLVAIQFPDTSAEKKYLVYYDERWDCKLFLNYKTVDRADEESVINKVSADLNVDKSQINCRYISSKVQEKYSESHQENRIYNHRLYEIKIQVFPEDEQKENFVVNGRHYYWMSISDMERDPNIVKKNLDVIDFVNNIQAKVNAQEGNTLPVSAFKDYVDGTTPSGAAAYEKRGTKVCKRSCRWQVLCILIAE